jgi:hypothetical protein
MNRPIVLTVAAVLAVAGTAYAQNQAPPAPGAQATPGATNPSTSDPSTATPSTVSPGTRSATPQSPDATSPSSASSPHQRQATGQGNTDEASTESGANPGAASSPHQRQATGTDRSGSKSDPDTQSARSRIAEADASGKVSAGMKVQSPAGTPIGTVKDIVPNRNGTAGYVLIMTPSGGNTAVPYATVAPMIQNGKIVLDSSKLEGAPPVRASDLQDPSNTRWKQQADEYWKGEGAQR